MALPATTEERLEELSRRIDVLAGRTQGGTEETRLGLQRRVDALRDEAASARAAVHDAAASIEESMLRLDTRINLAEQSAAADFAEDIAVFAAAASGELHSWDVYLERLQVKAATTAGDGRERAERAIRELRRHRNKVGARLAEVSSTSGEAWRQVREQVRAAREELESRAAGVEAGLGEGGDYVHGPRRQPGGSPS